MGVVSVVPAPGQCLQAIVSTTDRLLYRAKQLGQIAYDDTLTLDAWGRGWGMRATTPPGI